MFGRILIFSGLTGKVLRWIPTPDRRESYYPPQILTRMDGEQVTKSLNDWICGRCSCFRVYCFSLLMLLLPLLLMLLLMLLLLLLLLLVVMVLD